MEESGGGGGHGLHGNGSLDGGMAYWLLWQQCYGSVSISYGSGLRIRTGIREAYKLRIRPDQYLDPNSPFLWSLKKLCCKRGRKSLILLLFSNSELRLQIRETNELQIRLDPDPDSSAASNFQLHLPVYELCSQPYENA